jgi:FtsP/CotA-like multicopper oxidase with cupredoxin domain
LRSRNQATMVIRMTNLPPASPLRHRLSRRALIAGTGIGVVAILLSDHAATQPAAPETASDGFRVLRARPGQTPLRGGGQPPTAIQGYDGIVPGPLLRLRRGEELKVRLINELLEPTAIHWHGVRGPNAMDGVPGLTQAPVAPKDAFDYRIRVPDAGTFWYHAPFGSPVQVDGGLYGVLIVDEPEPPAVDRDVLMVLDDWMLSPAGEVQADGAEHLTVNSRPLLEIPVRTHERLRLRLLNATRSKLFGVGIGGHPVTVMAIDGQPAEPFEARDGRVVLAPGARTDLFVDAVHAAGSVGSIVLATSRGQAPIARLIYASGPTDRSAPLPEPKPLPTNPLPARMDFTRGLKLDVPLAADASRSALGGPGLRELPKFVAGERIWTEASELGSAAGTGTPLFAVKRGRTVMLALPNPTDIPIVVHLHGHHARLLDTLDDGWKPFWLDTVLALPGQTARIAFVADNPGKWTLHAHRVQAGGGAGLAAWFEVA